MALVATKDRVLERVAAGYADLEAKTPMREDCLFAIASLTKPMTAAALLMSRRMSLGSVSVIGNALRLRGIRLEAI